MCFDSQSICSCGCTATMTQNKRIIRLIVVWCDTVGILSAALALYRGVDWPGKRLHRYIDVMHHRWITVCCTPNSSRGPLHIVPACETLAMPLLVTRVTTQKPRWRYRSWCEETRKIMLMLDWVSRHAPC